MSDDASIDDECCLGLVVWLDVLNDEASMVDDECCLGVGVLENSTAAPLLTLA